MPPLTTPYYIDESLIHEFKTIREQLDTIHPVNAIFNQSTPPETPVAITYFRCGKAGHVATSCGGNLQQPTQNQQTFHGNPKPSHQPNGQ